MAKAKVNVYHKKGANYELDGSALSSDLNGLKIRAGILDDPKIAEYAAYNEFGTDRIPSRPFIRLAFTKNRKGYVAAAARIIKARIQKKSWVAASEDLGYQMQRDIQANIKDGMSPANAPSTIARKGHGHTLYETGKMHDAVKYEVDRRR